jgi:predicted Zn-dependent protease
MPPPIAEQDPALTAMLRGFERLAAGRADEAVQLFRDAMRAAPDLTPALVYVGACYAAGGHDREAAGAWQTALIEERDLVPLYSMLADALIRAREPGRASDILAKATTRWPNEIGLRRKRAIALASAGKRGEALAEIDAALSAAPNDAETACAGFRLDLETSDAAHTPDAAGAERRRGYARTCATGSDAVSSFASRWLQQQ